MSKQIHHVVRMAFYSTPDDDHDTDAAWNKVKRVCRSRKNPTFFYHALKYAATIIVITCIGIYAWHRFAIDTNVDSCVVNGAAQAELVLATGERIRLESAQHDISVEKSGIRINRDSVCSLECLAGALTEKELQTALHQLNVPKGGEYSLRLPDGSVVWINSESSLRFPTKFTTDSREVYLEGEAFFEVVKNTEAPFTVHANNKDVIVLGTRFNVSAYPDDRTWQTTLVEGRVSVRSGGEEKILYPSQQCVIDNQTGRIDVCTVDTKLYTSWLTGKFYFKGYRFEDVVKKLERWYDFQMQYEQEEIKEMLFRGVINKDRALEETLRYLEETTRIKFNINGKIITVGIIEN